MERERERGVHTRGLSVKDININLILLYMFSCYFMLLKLFLFSPFFPQER